MSDHNFYSVPVEPDVTGDPLSPDFIIDSEAVPAPKERTFWQMLLGFPDTTKTSGTLMEEAQRTAMVDQYKAALTYSAIQHTMAYSVMESQLASTSPQGAARIGALADAYTVQAIKAIGGR